MVALSAMMCCVCVTVVALRCGFDALRFASDCVFVLLVVSGGISGLARFCFVAG